MVTKEKKGPGTVAERIAELKFVADVDEMLLDGSSATDVSRFIQRTMMVLKDVAHSTITAALRARAKMLNEAVSVSKKTDIEVDQEIIPFHPAVLGPVYKIDDENIIHGDEPRTPTVLSRTMYARYVGGFDTLLEFESLYLAQRDRISKMMAMEERLGVPLEGTVVEIKEARMILQGHTKAKVALGLSGQEDRMRNQLDIQATRVKHGDAVADVLEDPKKRHKLLTAYRALSGLKGKPSQVVADVEATELG